MNEPSAMSPDTTTSPLTTTLTTLSSSSSPMRLDAANRTASASTEKTITAVTVLRLMPGPVLRAGGTADGSTGKPHDGQND